MAFVTYGEVYAHNHRNDLGTRAQQASVEASRVEIDGVSRVTYAWNVAYRTWKELDLAAQSARQAGDLQAASRFQKLREDSRADSELLSDKYFPQGAGLLGNAPPPDKGRYESDLYFREAQRLQQRAADLGARKQFWDDRVNQYITVLAFLSAALFIGGLALTVPRRLGLSLLGLSGVVVAAGVLYALYSLKTAEPRIPDGAIDSFADGQALTHAGTGASGAAEKRKDYDAAVIRFDEALRQYPNYVAALMARGDLHAQRARLLSLPDPKESQLAYHDSLRDYREAIRLGGETARLDSKLSRVHYMVGDFENAIALARRALSLEDLFPVRSNLALSLIASGRLDEGRAAMEEATTRASRQITDAIAAGRQPPESSWLALDNMARDLESLWDRADQSILRPIIDVPEFYEWVQAPPKETIGRSEEVRLLAQQLRGQVLSIAVALEETGMSPASSVNPPKLQILYVDVTKRRNASLDLSSFLPPFPPDVTEFAVVLRDAGVRRGQKVMLRIVYNGEVVQLFTRRESYTPPGGDVVSIKFSADSTLFVFPPGVYEAQLFVDDLYINSARFSVRLK